MFILILLLTYNQNKLASMNLTVVRNLWDTKMFISSCPVT